MIRALIFVSLFCGVAQAQDGFHSSRPQGFFGVGHHEWHHVYTKLRKDNGDSCCNGDECRPTQARYVASDNLWKVMVDGFWRDVPPSNIITEGGLAQRGLLRSDLSAEAHVCARENIYCVILPDPGG